MYLLGVVVRLLTQAIQLLRVLRLLALVAHELRQRPTALLGDSHAVAVEPITAQIAPDVELRFVVRRPTYTVQLFFLDGGPLGRRVLRRLRLLLALFLARRLGDLRYDGRRRRSCGFSLAAACAHFVLLASFHFRACGQLFGYFFL